MHPNQFEVNEAWIAFQLNAEPVHTEQGGSCNFVCLMDAASCFVLGHDMIPGDEAEPSPLQAKRLLEAGCQHKNEMPRTLFVPKGQFEAGLTAAARRERIDVVPVEEAQLLVFIGEARQGFKEHVLGKRRED